MEIKCLLFVTHRPVRFWGLKLSPETKLQSATEFEEIPQSCRISYPFQPDPLQRR